MKCLILQQDIFFVFFCCSSLLCCLLQYPSAFQKFSTVHLDWKCCWAHFVHVATNFLLLSVSLICKLFVFIYSCICYSVFLFTLLHSFINFIHMWLLHRLVTAMIHVHKELSALQSFCRTSFIYLPTLCDQTRLITP